jgi:hypothetical protein
MPPRKRREGPAQTRWVRYIVPIRPDPPAPPRPVDVFAPPGDPYRAAICATIVARLALPGAGR